ncbi:MAG TPA: ABC transporter permease, partial [Pyrinomonadaceae bacterium]
VIQDIKFGLRVLWKKPGFTLIAVLSLALGIGANTAIFSLTDAVLIKTLPVRQPEQLVLFGNGRDIGVKLGLPNSSFDLFSYPFYRQVQQRTDVFSGVASLLSMQWNMHGFVNANGSGSEIEQMKVQLVSGTYFPVLGVNAGLGRLFTDADDQTQGGHPVAVASYAWWQQRLGGDPSAVGKTITIDNIAYTIVGVAPKEFFGTTVGSAPDLWIPLAMEKQLPPTHWDQRNNNNWQSLYIIGRLQNGVTAAQANAVVNLLFKQSLQSRAGEQPSAKDEQDIAKATVELTPVSRGLSQLRRQFSVSLKVLMGVVALVLLIASANVANLLLAHGAARSREFAVRLAVGARRARLVRQLLTESALLALLGGIAGVALSTWGSRLLLRMASDGPEAVPVDVTPNLRILGFTIGVSALCAIVFGTAPALRAARTEPNTSLKNKTSSALKNPLGKTFVIVQVALSLLLLVGAGLFVRTLINLQNVPTGFNQENAMLFQVDTSVTRYTEDDPRLEALLSDVENSVRAVPGVQAASFASYTFNQGLWSGPAYTNEPNSLTDDTREIRNNIVGQDFFAAMGIPLVLGRTFGPQDTEHSPKVAVISESMAQRFFPNTSPLGKHFRLGDPEPSGDIEVVGVVKDAKYLALTENFAPIAFYPHTQRRFALINFVVRFSGPASSVVPQIRQAIKQVNHNLPIDDVVSLSDQIGRALVQQKLVARLATFFGLLALLLACVGLYGVMSYGVARRTNEIGIRMALGAQGRSVLWLVLREALLLVGIGLVVGVLASLAVTKTAASLLYELKPNDPLTIAGATLLLAAVAFIAGYLPARRASKVDPLVALRYE